MTYRPKIAAFLVFAALAAHVVFPALIAPAAAQFKEAPDETQRVPPTTALQIAMTFSRMTGQVPDFEGWVMGMREYQVASDFDKNVILETRVPELRQRYSLQSYDEPITVMEMVNLSRYSSTKKGFFVDSFSPDTFYSYNYGGKDYAIVPAGLMDYQWIAVADDEEGKKIEKRLSNNNTALMQIQMEPISADGKAALNIAGKDYWLMSGKIVKVRLFGARNEMIWESGALERKEKAQQELLDLYQVK
jgi:hypothetical protein